jgi:hypothetical protein
METDEIYFGIYWFTTAWFIEKRKGH